VTWLTQPGFFDPGPLNDGFVAAGICIRTASSSSLLVAANKSSSLARASDLNLRFMEVLLNCVVPIQLAAIWNRASKLAVDGTRVGSLHLSRPLTNLKIVSDA